MTPRGGKQQKLHSVGVRNFCSLPNTNRLSNRGDSGEWGVLRAWGKREMNTEFRWEDPNGRDKTGRYMRCY
jgi:hypothetical protein